MYTMMYFDTEDFLSPPDHPVHLLPGQMADIMYDCGLPASFHIIGEKVRFMERHGQTGVIDSISKHDVSLHFDRGSVHPTTAEEVSHLNWFEGVDRVLFRELPGVQTLQRVFGKCSGITRHGSTYAAQIAYATGKLGLPYFGSPFNLPGRNVAWFCNALGIATGEGGAFDQVYRDTEAFEEKLAYQQNYIKNRRVDVLPLFGCHPLITILEGFPCNNFRYGARPPRSQWKPEKMIPGVSIELVLKNFERRMRALADFPGLKWTTTGGIASMYGQRPVRVSEEVLLEGARAVVENGGPTHTSALSAGEILYLLARRKLAPADSYEVPQIMGPVEAVPDLNRSPQPLADMRAACLEITELAYLSGYLPEGLANVPGRPSLEAALLALACDAAGVELASIANPNLTAEAVPGFIEAAENVAMLKDWTVHDPNFGQESVSRYFRWQIWTLKPAFRAEEYGPGIETGNYLNPTMPF